MSKITYSHITVFIIILALLLIMCCLYVKTNKNSISNEGFNNVDNQVVVRMFYVDWCGHCKTTKPHFKSFKDSNDGTQINGKDIKIEMINCEENEVNAKLAESMNVEGYPTILADINGNISNFNYGNRTEDNFLLWLKQICK